MSKTSVKRKRRHTIIDREKLSDRNRKLYDELEQSDRELSGKDIAILKDTFSKERVITYMLCIFCPPVGVYRLWYRFSTFTMAERYLWTFMMAVAMAKLLQTIF